MIYKDAIRYVGMQPLYAFWVALVSSWVGDFELAGKLVSSFFGILIVFPVYFLGKQIFDRKIAFVSALLLAIHPYIRRFSADVLKESTYLFFLSFGIWFAWKTIENEKKYPYLFIPLFSAIAYLVRPDGIQILLVALFYILFRRKSNALGSKWRVILLLLIPSAILSLPCFIHLSEMTGPLMVDKAEFIIKVLSFGVSNTEVPLTDRVVLSLKRLNSGIFSVYHPLYGFFLAIGLHKRISSHFKNGDKFLISFFVLHYVVLFLIILNITEWGRDGTIWNVRFSGRHVLPLLLFSIYWAGEGIVTVYQWIYKRVESHGFLRHLDSKRKSILVWGTLCIMVLAIVLPKTLDPQRYERLPEKWAGMWIKNQYGKGLIIFTTVHRVPHYAEGNSARFIDLKEDTIDEIRSSMIETKALYLVIRGREIMDFPEEALQKDFVELNRFEGKGMEKIIVYKIVR